MRQWRYWIVAVCFVLFCHSSAAAEELIIGRIALGAPMLFESSEGELQGIFVDLASELQQRLSLPVTVKVVPRKRIEAYTLEGRIHLFGLIHPKWLPDTKDQFNWSAQICSVKNVIVTHKNRQILDYDDFNGLRVGGRLGFIYSDELMQKFQNGDASRHDVKSEQQNYEKLILNRVDAIVTSSSYIAQHYLNTVPKYQENLHISPLVDSSEPHYFAISKHSPVPVDTLKQAFNAMKEDGTLERIFSAYDVDYVE